MITWNVSPEIIDFGFLKLRWYGLMFLAGFTIGLRIMRWMFKREGRDASVLDSLLMHMVTGTIIGSRLGHCLFYDPSYYFSNPLKIFAIWEGGLASHGGAIGVLIACAIFARKNPKFSFLWIMDRIAVVTVLTGSFIRIGNLMNSEILGRPTDVPWAFIFTRVDQVPRHPAQLYESLSYLIIFTISILTYRFYSKGKNTGLLFSLVTGLIFFSRFFIEFYKENQEAFEKGMILNMGQILSIPFVLVSLWLFIRAQRRKQA